MARLRKAKMKRVIAMAMLAVALGTPGIANASGGPMHHAVNCHGREMDVINGSGATPDCPSGSHDIKPQPNMSHVPSRWAGDPHMLQGTYPK